MKQRITAHPASGHDARFLAYLDFIRQDESSQAFLAERRAHWADELPKGAAAPNIQVVRDNNSLYMGYVVLHRAFGDDKGPIAAYEMKLTSRFDTGEVRKEILERLEILPQPDYSSIESNPDRVLEPA